MTKARSEAVGRLITELESFSIDLSDYYGDAEPQSVYDSILTGKLDALACFCRALGWSDLAQQIQDLLPLQCSAVEAMTRVQGYVLPELRHLLASAKVDDAQNPNDWFWQFVHPRICALARPRFDAGFFGDAVEASFKEVNDSVKRIFREVEKRELDGHGLMTTAFSPTNPVIRLSTLETDSERNEQQGYMHIFAGSMTGIRNPKAHGNLNPDSRKALHLISLASLLLCKIDERI